MWYVSAAVVRDIAQRILHVLRLARRAVLVASKGILLVSAKVLKRLQKKRFRGVLRHTGMDFGM